MEGPRPFLAIRPLTWYSGAGSAPDPPDYAPIPQSAPGPQSVTGRAASPVTTADGGNRRLGLALLVIATAQLRVVLDATIVNVALPHIQQALGFSDSGLEWVVNAYAVTFGGLLLLGGRAGDILGRRRVFVFGLLLFSGASLVGGFAISQWWLLTARAVQGAGGAVIAPTALALITINFPEGGERNRAFGVYAAMAGAGSAVGLRPVPGHYRPAAPAHDPHQAPALVIIDLTHPQPLRHRPSFPGSLPGRVGQPAGQARSATAPAGDPAAPPAQWQDCRHAHAGQPAPAVSASARTATPQPARQAARCWPLAPPRRPSTPCRHALVRRSSRLPDQHRVHGTTIAVPGPVRPRGTSITCLPRRARQYRRPSRTALARRRSRLSHRSQPRARG